MATDKVRVAQEAQPPEDPAVELARVQAAIGTLVSMMTDAHDERIVAVGKNFFEVLGGQTAVIKDKHPPWSLEWQADWIDSQLAAIETSLAKLAAELPDELRQKVGTQLVDDHLDNLKARTAELLDTIREGCTKTLERDLPNGMKYRANRPTADSEDEDDETSSAVAQDPFRIWVTSLHGGQLAMMLVFAGLLALALAVGAFLACAARAVGIVTYVFIAASLALVIFAAWSLWVWLGGRTRPPNEPPSRT